MNVLSEHQKEKFDEFCLKIETEKEILIKGSAGVGKTFLVSFIADYLKTKVASYRILCSAPTHKALSVIQSKINGELKFSTLHSSLHYKAITDKTTGEREFVSVPSEKYPPLKGIKYWIIDESSMIDTDMLKNIRLHAYRQGIKVIFVGDGKQLNPVGEEDSPVFIEEQLVSLELTEIVRQGAGNPIIELSRNLGRIIDYQEKLTEEGHGYLYTINYNKIIEELAKVNGTDEMKYLAWTNAEIDKINSEVRKRIYGEFPNKVELGETIVMDGPYKDYNTNQEIKVEKLEEIFYKRPVVLEERPNFISEEATFKVYKINDEILILHDDAIPLYKRYVAIMSANAKKNLLSFESRNNFMSLFATFKYNHALTVHKSQGSTYKQAIINIKNIEMNPNKKEKKRLLYTAITRASDLVILYNV